MKKWLITIIALLILVAGAAQGSMITFEDIADGQPGSITNPLETSDFIDVYISLDVPFFAMDIVVAVSGPAQIVYATGIDTAADFGWDVPQSNNPIFSTDSVEIGLAVDIWGLKNAGQAAKITLKALGQGQVILSLSNGTNFEKSTDHLFGKVQANDTLTIYQTAPEPTTIALLLLGAMMFKSHRKY